MSCLRGDNDSEQPAVLACSAARASGIESLQFYARMSDKVLSALFPRISPSGNLAGFSKPKGPPHSLAHS